MVAITFAEVGEHDSALQFLRRENETEVRKRQRRRVNRQAEERPTLRL